MNKKINIIIILILIIIGAGLFFSLYDFSNDQTVIIKEKEELTEFVSDEFNYSLEYPIDWWHNRVPLENLGNDPLSSVIMLSLDEFGVGDYSDYKHPYSKDKTMLNFNVMVYSVGVDSTIDDAMSELGMNDMSNTVETINDNKFIVKVRDDSNHEMEAARMYIKNYYIQNDSYFYEISFAALNKTVLDENITIIDSTLNSIEFNNTNLQSTISEDWKTVSSNIYGYEISFPEGWYWSQGNKKHDPSTDVPVIDILISPDQCYFTSDCMTSSEILVRLEVSNMVCNTSQECADYLDYLPGCRTYSDRQLITIDGFEATQQFEYPGEGCATEQSYTSSIFWKRDNNTFHLTGSNINQEDFSKYADVFEQIGQSIKFK